MEIKDCDYVGVLCLSYILGYVAVFLLVLGLVILG